MKNKFFNKLVMYFIRGILLVIPSWLTIYVISAILKKLDGILKIYIPGLGLYIPGLGLVILLMIVTFVGYVGSSFLMKSILESIDTFFLKIPLVNMMYSSFKDLTSAIVNNKKKFDSPVLLIMTREPLVKKVGFVTQKDLKKIDLPGMVAVYVPNTYTISGDLYIVKKEDVMSIKLSPTETMKFAISGGVTKI